MVRSCAKVDTINFVRNNDFFEWRLQLATSTLSRPAAKLDELLGVTYTRRTQTRAEHMGVHDLYSHSTCLFEDENASTCTTKYTLNVGAHGDHLIRISRVYFIYLGVFRFLRQQRLCGCCSDSSQN